MDATKFNPLTVLGLAPAVIESANDATILKLADASYKALAGVYHSDKGGEGASNDKFNEIAAAIALLREPGLIALFKAEVVRQRGVHHEMKQIGHEISSIDELQASAARYLEEIIHQYGSLLGYQKSLHGLQFNVSRARGMGQGSEVSSQVGRSIPFVRIEVSKEGLLRMKEEGGQWTEYPKRLIVGSFLRFDQMGVEADFREPQKLSFRYRELDKSAWGREKDVVVAYRDRAQLSKRRLAIFEAAHAVINRGFVATPEEFAMMVPYMRAQDPTMYGNRDIVTLSFEKDQPRFIIEGVLRYGSTTKAPQQKKPSEI